MIIHDNIFINFPILPVLGLAPQGIVMEYMEYNVYVYIYIHIYIYIYR